MRTHSFFILVPFLALTGCSAALGTSELGKDHKASFSYAACLFGCTVSQPMMVGTQEGIGVTADSMPPVTISSSAPDIIDIRDASRSCCTQSSSSSSCRTVQLTDACNANEHAQLEFDVGTLAAGSADISLVDMQGNVFDVVTLTASNPASLTLTCDQKLGSVVLEEASSCAAGWTATDASGTSLLATTGVDLSSSDPSIVAFSGLLDHNEPMVSAAQGLFGTEISAIAPGVATITATTRTQLATTLSVTVTQ